MSLPHLFAAFWDKVGLVCLLSCVFFHEYAQCVACNFMIMKLYTGISTYIRNGWGGAFVGPDGMVKIYTSCVLGKAWQQKKNF